MIENFEYVKEDEKIFAVTSTRAVTIACCEWMAFARHTTRVSSKINATGFKIERIKELANNSLDVESWHDCFFKLISRKMDSCATTKQWEDQ